MDCCVCGVWLLSELTHWGRVTHICVSELPTIGSDNGLSPGRRQAIIWTNAGILLIRTLGINFSEILSEIHTLSFKKMYLKMSSGKPAAILSRPRYVNDDLLWDEALGTNSSEIWIKILTFPIKEMYLKMLYAKRRPFCLCFSMLNSTLWTFGLNSCTGISIF